MHGPRKTVGCLLLLGALALALPAVTLASGGGSAGDQQYVDPFAHSQHSGSSHKTSTTSTTTNAPAPATSTPAPVTTTSGPTTTTPTATTAGTTSTSSPTLSKKSAKKLPYTGYDSWLAGGFGLVLAAAGLGLRRKAQRS